MRFHPLIPSPSALSGPGPGLKLGASVQSLPPAWWQEAFHLSHHFQTNESFLKKKYFYYFISEYWSLL